MPGQCGSVGIECTSALLGATSKGVSMLFASTRTRTYTDTERKVPMHPKYPPLQETARNVGSSDGEHVEFLVEYIPPTDCISRNINPRELMTDTMMDYNKHIRAEFGEYKSIKYMKSTKIP